MDDRKLEKSVNKIIGVETAGPKLWRSIYNLALAADRKGYERGVRDAAKIACRKCPRGVVKCAEDYLSDEGSGCCVCMGSSIEAAAILSLLKRDRKNRGKSK